MKNYVQPGETLTLPAPYDVASGDGVMIGKIFGVAQHEALAGEALTMVRRGVYTMAKTSAEAWTVGQKVFWDATNRVLTATDTDNTLVGAAVDATANPSGTGAVLLDGTLR